MVNSACHRVGCITFYDPSTRYFALRLRSFIARSIETLRLIMPLVVLIFESLKFNCIFKYIEAS